MTLIKGKVNLKSIFQFYFLIRDISLDMALILSRLNKPDENNDMQGTVSLNCYLGLNFYFMYFMGDFFILYTLHFIKQK